MDGRELLGISLHFIHGNFFKITLLFIFAARGLQSEGDQIFMEIPLVHG